MTQKRKSTGHIIASGLLFVACPAAPLFAGFLFAYRDPLSFVLTMLVHLAALAYVVRFARGWRRPREDAGLGDYVLAAAPVLAGGLTLATTDMLASAYGISGSALPRVLYAAPTPVDFAYLAAIAVIVVTMISGLVFLALLARSHLPANILGRLVRSASTAVATRLHAAPDGESSPAHVTGTPDRLWRRLMSPVSWGVFGVSGALSVAALWIFFAEYSAQADLAGWTLLLAAVPVTVWAVLQSLWRPDEQFGVVLAAPLRAIVVPLVTVPLLTALNLAVGMFSPVNELFGQHKWPSANWESLVPGEESTLLGWLGMVGLIAFFFALMSGLIVSVAIVLPVTAIWKPRQFIKDNQMSTKPKDRAKNTAAVRAIAFILPLAFLIPSLMVPFDSTTVWWWLGLVLIPVGAGAVYFVWSRQRVDHTKREKWGTSGIGTPADPPPDDSDR